MKQKPWASAVWRRKRADFIKDKSCEWCGSEEKLTIDHERNAYRDVEFDKIARQFMRKYFADGKNEEELKALKKIAMGEITPHYYYACPKCGYSVKQRKNKTFKCYRCGITVGTPEKKLGRSTILYLHRRVFDLFRENHYKEIKAVFTPHMKKLDEEYFSFKDVHVLCHRCNYARLKGMHLCPTCKERYVSNRFEVCSTCYFKTDKGKEYLKQRELEQAEIDVTLPCGVTIKMKEIDFEMEGMMEACGGNCPNPEVKGNFHQCEAFKKYYYNSLNEESPDGSK
jgi:hypothetical protein